tara:strand:+ start:2632 stop:2790 length:159 start_codon:yes stop_codon:yes gene_type:complete
MPYRIVKEEDHYRLYNTDKKKTLKMKFKTRSSAKKYKDNYDKRSKMPKKKKY